MRCLPHAAHWAMRALVLEPSWASAAAWAALCCEPAPPPRPAPRRAPRPALAALMTATATAPAPAPAPADFSYYMCYALCASALYLLPPRPALAAAPWVEAGFHGQGPVLGRAALVYWAAWPAGAGPRSQVRAACDRGTTAACGGEETAPQSRRRANAAPSPFPPQSRSSLPPWRGGTWTSGACVSPIC